MEKYLAYGALGLAAIIVILAARRSRDQPQQFYAFLGFGIVMLIVAAYYDGSRIRAACASASIARLAPLSDSVSHVQGANANVKREITGNQPGNAMQNANAMDAPLEDLRKGLLKASVDLAQCR